MTLKTLNISDNWTLFLDRDGVINRRLVDDYVKSWEDFVFLDGVLDAIRDFSKVFGKIIVVTNQQGVGKGLMPETTLNDIHSRMRKEITNGGGRIDGIYFCPGIKEDHPFCRKPQVGMALLAKKDHPEIDFKRSIMAGDSLSDLRFGKRLKMKTVLISEDNELACRHPSLTDFWFKSLLDFSKSLHE
nr:HAD family hydrolase [Bacteroidota bacterium]